LTGGSSESFCTKAIRSGRSVCGGSILSVDVTLNAGHHAAELDAVAQKCTGGPARLVFIQCKMRLDQKRTGEKRTTKVGWERGRPGLAKPLAHLAPAALAAALGAGPVRLRGRCLYRRRLSHWGGPLSHGGRPVPDRLGHRRRFIRDCGGREHCGPKNGCN